MSLYVSHPGAAPAKIGGYPKRHRQKAAVSAVPRSVSSDGPSYADFFAVPAAAALAG